MSGTTALPLVILRDVIANRPTAGTAGRLFYATDTYVWYRDNGSSWDAAASVTTAGIVIDGGGSSPAAGLKGFIQMPFAGTIVGWSIIADQSGSASLDIWKIASSAPPSAPVVPTSANKISASAPVALSSAQSASSASSGVSTWTTACAQWDVIGFNLVSVTTCTRLLVQLYVVKG